MKKNSTRRTRRSNRRHSDLPSYETIQAATRGDPDALGLILQHYDDYITRLSLRRLHDEFGNTYLCVDEAMRRRLEVKLLTGILAFQTA